MLVSLYRYSLVFFKYAYSFEVEVATNGSQQHFSNSEVENIIFLLLFFSFCNKGGTADTFTLRKEENYDYHFYHLG
jgi:hypothetical protein